MSTTPLKLWLGLLMMFAGPFFFCCGCMEFQHATETTAEPLNVKLSELESGSVPTNKHLCIGPHVACYFALYYEYYQREGDNAAPGPDQKLASVVYPIVSEQYFTGTFLFDELDELDEPSESGGTNESEETVEPRESDERDDASADADPVTDHDDKSLADLGSEPEVEPPAAPKFAVLVETKRFRRLKDVPDDDIRREESVQGLVLERGKGLSSRERALLSAEFPGTEFDRVLVLKEGKRPWPAWKSLGMLLGGVSIVPLGMVLAIWGLVEWVARPRRRPQVVDLESADPQTPPPW
jgi:hypothetical protein